MQQWKGTLFKLKYNYSTAQRIRLLVDLQPYVHVTLTMYGLRDLFIVY